MNADERRLALAAEVRRLRGNLSYQVMTFGCQMNQHDSLRLMGWCDEFGWTNDEDNPDVLIFNTCCVRDGAERRVHGQIAALKAWRQADERRMIIVCGCMMQQPNVAEAFIKRHRFVDAVMGTHALARFPELVVTVLREGRAIDVAEDCDIPEGIPARAEHSPVACVAVGYGCDNFCTYCIVPTVRGRERSRAQDDIMREIEALAAEGVSEVMLLGQNVNSYAGAPGGFAALLRRVRTLGLRRIRFMTSHPKDLSDDLIAAMAEGGGVCAQLHLPLQSGSSRVLAAMNRGYTAEHYLSLVEKARAAMPDLGLTTDIIVGFPGEDESDFAQTLEVVRKAKPDGAYTFLYSPRKGTPAYDMPGRIDRAEMSRRNTILRKELDAMTAQALAAHVGLRREVLLETRGEKDDGMLFGRIERGFRLGLRGDAALIGKTVMADITGAAHHTLIANAVTGEQ